MKGAVEERVNSGAALYIKVTWLIIIIIIIIIILLFRTYRS
jgi:hypothetical protein